MEKRKLGSTGFAVAPLAFGGNVVGRECGATPAQVSLAWLIGRPGVTAPIASATSLRQLQELIAGTRLHLEPDLVRRLDDASAPDARR